MSFCLIYKSNKAPNFEYEALANILSIARDNNSKLGVTGALFYNKVNFVQVLEGERDVVLSLYSNIQNDKRHNQTKLLYQSLLQENNFTDWSMAFVPCVNVPEWDIINQINDYHTLSDDQALRIISCAKALI